MKTVRLKNFNMNVALKKMKWNSLLYYIYAHMLLTWLRSVKPHKNHVKKPKKKLINKIVGFRSTVLEKFALRWIDLHAKCISTSFVSRGYINSYQLHSKRIHHKLWFTTLVHIIYAIALEKQIIFHWILLIACNPFAKIFHCNIFWSKWVLIFHRVELRNLKEKIGLNNWNFNQIPLDSIY